MATAGKGLPFIGKMNQFLDRVLHPTVQKAGASRAAIDVIHRGYYVLNPVPTVAYIVEAGSTDNIVKLTAHGFKPGDLFRINTSANPINEFEVIIDEIVDANTFLLAGYLSASLTAGDTFFALRPVSERFAADGSTLASLATPPVSYNRKIGGITTQTSVLEDLDVPASSRAMPVVLHGVDAASITITSGDLNIASSHVNDSMSIGDGTRIVNTTTNFELKTHDTDLLTNIGLQADAVATTDTGSFSVIAFIKRGMQNWTTLLGRIPANLTVTATRLLVDGSGVTQPVSGTVTVTATDLDVRNLVFATDKVDVSGSSITVTATDLDVRNLVFATDKVDASGSSVTVSNTVTVSATDLDVRNLVFATDKVDSSGSSVSNLPATIGQKTSAASLSVVLSSDHASVPVTISGTVPVAQGALSSFYVEVTNLTTVNQFILSGVTCKKIYIQADSDNTANIRMKITNSATVATISSGWKLEPGRSESFDMGGSSLNCSVGIIAESGTNQKVYVQYGN